ncbi:MAG TPA: beta-eliminating lyase-related protein [Alphaproteobacteria bacterium]|nr:beta-eliminating lyase-related protein [Alphaproteobacteria bacterium]
MNFKSDNICGVSPEIMTAMIDANVGYQPSYENDDVTKELENRLFEVFETPVWFCFAATGSASNALALSLMARPYEGIICQEEAHVLHDECSTPNRFTGGAKLYGISGKDVKIDFDKLQNVYEHAMSMKPHVALPRALTLSQATECGTVYSLEEISRTCNWALERGIKTHMDGARFANALAYLGCSPAEMTWKSGVQLLSLGATKNGAMSAEALIVFDETLAQDLKYAQKSVGQLYSKARFYAAQFLAYFKDGLWLKNAQHANNAARELEEIFKNHAYEAYYPVQSNALFIKLDNQLATHLQESGVGFYPWTKVTKDLYRFVTNCFSSKEEIETFKNVIESFKK